MASKSPFVSPFGSRDAADKKKAEMAIGTSDHLTMWNAYNKVDAFVCVFVDFQWFNVNVVFISCHLLKGPHQCIACFKHHSIVSPYSQNIPIRISTVDDGVQE